MQVQDFLKLIDGKIITGSGETVVNDFYILLLLEKSLMEMILLEMQ